MLGALLDAGWQYMVGTNWGLFGLIFTVFCFIYCLSLSWPFSIYEIAIRFMVWLWVHLKKMLSQLDRAW